jgi:ATP-dependent protease ClpP protease subunit
MIHKSYASPQFATSDRLQAVAHMLVLDDERVEAIFRRHLKLDDSHWATHKTADLWFSGKEAITAGLASEIAEFSPPKRQQMFYVGLVL